MDQDNSLITSEMLELRRILIDFIRDFFGPNQKAIIPISGGVDSVTTLFLLVEALGRERVVGFHLPQDLTPNSDSENFDLSSRMTGIESYKLEIEDLTTRLIRTLPPFRRMSPDRAEFIGARIPAAFHIREGLVYAFGYLNKGRYRAVGALDRAEYLTGNFPKYSCTMDIAPILGMYRQQVRGLAALLGVPETIINQNAENDSDCIPLDRMFQRGEIALDCLLYLIYERQLNDDEIHRLGRRYGVEFNQNEIDLVRNLIQNSLHKRVLHIPYPPVTNLGINERNLITAYREGRMIYPTNVSIAKLSSPQKKWKLKWSGKWNWNGPVAQPGRAPDIPFLAKLSS